MPHQCAHWFAMTCRRRGRVRECKDVGRVRCAEGRACQRVQGPPPLSLRGAKRRGNPYSLQQHKTKSNSSRQIRRSCEFALCTTVLPGISAGMRIAAPVCALVRNDMQKAVACQRLQGVVRNDMLKTDTCQRLQGRGAQGARKHAGCQRLQGRFPAVHRQCPGIVRTGGKFLHVIARSGATWQSVTPAAAQNEQQYFGRMRESVTNLP